MRYSNNSQITYHYYCYHPKTVNSRRNSTIHFTGQSVTTTVKRRSIAMKLSDRTRNFFTFERKTKKRKPKQKLRRKQQQQRKRSERRACVRAWRAFPWATSDVQSRRRDWSRDRRPRKMAAFIRSPCTTTRLTLHWWGAGRSLSIPERR